MSIEFDQISPYANYINLWLVLLYIF